LSSGGPEPEVAYASFAPSLVVTNRMVCSMCRSSPQRMVSTQRPAAYADALIVASLLCVP
jgi:hypothetical protein